MNSRPATPPTAHWLTACIHRQTVWRWLLAVLMIVVCALALPPTVPKELSFSWDKLNHTLAFAALAGTARLGFPGSWRKLGWIAAALLAFGGLIEVLQHFVPGRSADWEDLLADAIGIVLGAATAQGTLRWAALTQPAAR